MKKKCPPNKGMNCAHAAVVDVKELKPNPRNPNRHPDEQIALLAKNIRAMGWRHPVIVSKRSGFVVAGHARVEAAKLLGKTKVPVDFQDFASDAQEMAYMIADNRIAELAERDNAAIKDLLQELDTGAMDMDLTGYTEKALEELMLQEHQGEEVDLQFDREGGGLRKQWGIELGQLWKLGEHRLMCGDSTNAETVARLCGPAKPLLMVTDPPYGVEYDPSWRNKSKLSTTKKTGKVENDDRASWAAAYSLFTGDVAYVWHAGKFASAVERSLASCGFEIRSQIVWVKTRFAISRGQYHWRHEPCWYAVREGSQAHWIGGRKQQTTWADIVDHWTGDDQLFAGPVDEKTIMAFDANTTTVWEISSSDGSGVTTHGTQKPVECMARAIRNHDSEYIYEPFSGSGTTIIACEQLKRKCLAIEINPEYVAIAIDRWATLTKKTPRLI